MRPREAAIKIFLKINDGCTLTIQPTSGKSLDVPSNLNRLKLVEQRRILYEDLDRFKQILKSDSVNWPDASAAIRILHRRGTILLRQLFNGNNEKLAKARNVFQEARPEWRQTGWGPGSPSPPLVQVITKWVEDIVPLELLPLMDKSEPPEVVNYRTLCDAATRFLGFSMIVGRVIESMPQIGSTRIENVPKLPIKLFHDAKLPGARAEAAFFEKEPSMDLDGPWPDKPLSKDELITRLAEHLRRPDIRFDKTIRYPPDQIHHFSCECNTTAEITEEFCLELSHPSGRRYRVNIGDLDYAFTNLDPPTDGRCGVLPLVVLNACGTSKLSPGGIISFPEFFLRSKNRGFIGTEAAIPDDFAAAFSKKFYLELLRWRSLGEAVYYTRWALLKRRRNPLGILFTAYANPDMKLRKRVLGRL